VTLVLVVLLAAVAVGRLLGGSLERLGSLELRRRGLVVAAVALQLLGGLVGGPAHPVGLVLSAGCVVAFLLANRGVAGTGLVALGLGTNALVVALNGAMPVSTAALERAGGGAAVSGLRHEPADGGTRLSWLGDVVPVPLPLRPEVVSPGDVLVAAGVAQVVVAGMLRPRRGVPRLPARARAPHD
jgi:hypothetical protein